MRTPKGQIRRQCRAESPERNMGQAEHCRCEEPAEGQTSRERPEPFNGVSPVQHFLDGATGQCHAHPPPPWLIGDRLEAWLEAAEPRAQQWCGQKR